MPLRKILRKIGKSPEIISVIREENETFQKILNVYSDLMDKQLNLCNREYNGQRNAPQKKEKHQQEKLGRSTLGTQADEKGRYIPKGTTCPDRIKKKSNTGKNINR